jgi:hypothetical protein
MGLYAALRILFVLGVRSLTHYCLTALDDLSLHDRDALVRLVELKPIAPAPTVVEVQLGLDRHVRVAPRVQRADLRDAMPCAHRSLKSALRISDVAQEADGIQQVRFSGRVGANQEDAALERDID